MIFSKRPDQLAREFTSSIRGPEGPPLVRSGMAVSDLNHAVQYGAEVAITRLLNEFEKFREADCSAGGKLYKSYLIPYETEQ